MAAHNDTSNIDVSIECTERTDTAEIETPEARCSSISELDNSLMESCPKKLKKRDGIKVDVHRNGNESGSSLSKLDIKERETNGPLHNGYEEEDDSSEQYNRLHNGVQDPVLPDGHHQKSPVATAHIHSDEDWEKDLREEHPYTEDLLEMSKNATYLMSRPDDAYCPGDRHAVRIKWRKRSPMRVPGQFEDGQFEDGQ